MKSFLSLLHFTVLIIFSINGYAQVAINIDGGDPDASSMLDVKSSTKGVIFPGFTSVERELITYPANGLIILNTDIQTLQIYDGTIWKNISVDACGDPYLDQVNNHVYRTVLIGTQCWFVENLKATKYNDSTVIPLVTDNTTWINLSTPAYCWYNHDSAAFPNTYGALYNWYAVNNGELCPSGWHVPSDAEITELMTFLGGNAIAGGKLKEVGTVHWLSGTGVTNESGFTALPGGLRSSSSGAFSGNSTNGRFWTTTQQYSYNAWLFEMRNNTILVLRNAYDKTFGYSVRCLKD